MKESSDITTRWANRQKICKAEKRELLSKYPVGTKVLVKEFWFGKTEAKGTISASRHPNHDILMVEMEKSKLIIPVYRWQLKFRG